MSFGRARNSGGNNPARTLPFGLGFADVGTNETTEFPSIQLPVNNPINHRERSLAITYIKFSQTVKDGPFYTGSLSLAVDDTSDNKKKPSLIEEEGQADGIERYSDRYLKRRKIGTCIDEHPYNLEVFPKELYHVMGIDKKKLLILSKFNNADDIFTGVKENSNIGASMLEKWKELAEDEGLDGENDGDNEKNKDNGDEDVDEDFDEEEDDDDDYNAEKYFNEGDDDEYGDEDDMGDEPAF